MKTTPYLNKDYHDDEMPKMHLYCYAKRLHEQGNIRMVVRPIHMATPSWSTKADDMGMDDMNLSAVHVICNQCSILPNKEN